MPLGAASKAKLATCHGELQLLIERVANGVDEGDLTYAGVKDIVVTCGYRGEAEQNKAVAEGNSRLPWPCSKHNRTPSDAVDVVPYPEKWSDAEKLKVLHAYIAGVAHGMGISLFDISWDLPHVQRAVP